MQMDEATDYIAAIGNATPEAWAKVQALLVDRAPDLLPMFGLGGAA